MLKLNILGRIDGKQAVVKTYETESYQLTFGTVEDLLEIVGPVFEEDVTEDDGQRKVMEAVGNGMNLIKPILCDVFPGLTTEELRNTTLLEIVSVVIDIISSVKEETKLLATKKLKALK